MAKVGQAERVTQNQVIRLFQNRLGYEYLGDWSDEFHTNMEEKYLVEFLQSQGYNDILINKAVNVFGKLVGVQTGELYDNNKNAYSKLRYGISVNAEIDETKQTVKLIDWENPENNHFAIAEEVSIKGTNNKRPDIVIYLNGIALAVIELKKSTVSIGKGIRQNLDNQRDDFIRPFFNSIQLVVAGNESSGMKYGTIETPEKYFLEWKEETSETFGNNLDKHIVQFFDKRRLLEIIHDFVIYDGGIKKTCRPHQYFGVKAAQERIAKREGGIIWHTQGSGKSLTMVWLAQWIRENIKDSRIVVITDRTELDKQIAGVFKNTGEEMVRAESGSDLLYRLNRSDIPLLSTLIHKFGPRNETSFPKYLKEIKKYLPNNFNPKGEIFVFVDECHRTQSGRLHKAMKAILPDNAMFIGFTGTPLLKKDKKTSLETFGPYIHTYKFDEAVEDNVVLDIRYEARDIEQEITAQTQIDDWFESKTKGMNDVAKDTLKKRWGTMKRVLSSRGRINKIAMDIEMDFSRVPRLKSGYGNAMLVASSVYEACKYYEEFQRLDTFKNKCATITSYEPSAYNIKGEETGEGETQEQYKYRIHNEMLDGRKSSEFEEEAKRKFIDEPARMKLLIVVDKLLTGFDAPPTSYLYIDKSMQDHALFQAICRVNRLDDESKEYGYIVDYKDLFRCLETSIKKYTSEAFESYDSDDVSGLLKDRYEQAKEKLDEALDRVVAICEPANPKTMEGYRLFFGTEAFEFDEDERLEYEEKRGAFYKAVNSLIRAYGEIANEMDEAGYSDIEANNIKYKAKYYTNLMEDIKQASGDYIDLKSLEPGMRSLIDNYIDASHSRRISSLDDYTLVDLIVKKGLGSLDEVLSDNIKQNKEAMAEAVENSIRKVIIEESPSNPVYFGRMSELLKELIAQRKLDVLDYKKYLDELAELAKKVKRMEGDNKYPESIRTDGQKSLYDNLYEDEELANKVHSMVKESAQDDWRGNKIKERMIVNKLSQIDFTALPSEFEIKRLIEVLKNNDEY